jgi:uncharacterized protein (UPF0335 family)
MTDAHAIARDQLKSIVERVERLEAEISDLNADKSDIYKEARSNGYDVKAIKKVVSKRKLDDNERQEQDAVFDTYWDAIHGTNLVHAHARENIEEFDPITGEFVNEPSAPVRSDGGLNIVHKHTEIATASQGEAEAPTGSTSGPTEGGVHEEIASTHSFAAQAGASVQVAPAAKLLRPHCLNKENCGGYGRNHCHSCLSAMRELEAAE